jgi:ubiquinone/menaquinone biosynthesis C-methylase UbiE
MSSQDPRVARWRRQWDKQARSYDKQIRFFERILFGDSRAWVCAQATGDVLEVAIGTGLNLACYPPEIRLTGIEWSPAMLEIARHRAAELHRCAELLEGDAQDLPFPDESFDTVVCTFGLCAIPDDHRAIAEMHRVLRPGGRLLLADHVPSTAGATRAIQWLLEKAAVPLAGEHFLRRPLTFLRAQGWDIQHAQRFKLGIVERLVAGKPSPEPSTDRSPTV